MKIDDLQILILGTHKHPILTLSYIELPCTVYYNKDWEAVPFTVPENIRLSSLQHEPQHFRCFRGHQEALKTASKEYILMLEDDAVPNCADWITQVLDSCELLDEYDFVSLHGRKMGSHNSFFHKGREYCKLNPITNDQVTNMCWALGSLAYLTKKSRIDKFINHQYNGIAIDIWIYNQNTCILKRSPFDHNRKYGSLIENNNKDMGIQKAQ